jgi:hypothetical protein
MSTDRIDRDTFCRTYVPMARAGKTALEIANELGVDKPTDEEKSQFVSQKASNYRKELRTDALAKAKEAKLDEEATKALVEATTAKLPRLSKRTRTTDSFVDFLDELLAECDADPAEEGEESAEETATETPE